MGIGQSWKKLFEGASSFEASLDKPFLHFDVAGVAQELRLEERGAENGAQGIPAPDTRARDAVEEEIVSRVSRAWQEATSEAARWFQACDQRIANNAVLTELPALEMAAIQAETEIKSTVAQASVRLTTDRDAVTQSYARLRAFQKENGLQRPAKLTPLPVLSYALIALAWIAETAANSVLLQKNDDLGLIGGIFAAAAIGFVNVLAAVSVGRLVLPKLQSRSQAGRYAALLGLVVWLLFVVCWNLLAAHYRDAKVAGLQNPEAVALTMMGALPASIYSWGLLILGALCAVVAGRTAYNMDDPCPGYGQVWREHEQRCEDYAGALEEVGSELKEFHEQASGTFDGLRKGLAQQLADQSRAINSRVAFAHKLEQYHAQLEQAGRQLLAIYRDANRAARDPSAPARFEEDFNLPSPHIPLAPQAALSANDVERLDIKLASAQRAVSDAYLEGVRGFETLEALKTRLA
ncbi:hypothetical protein IP88_04015 [alpha proteobacterium AAP81b]|nr:hypothetical protein IP88_04015 [alpha proteobacterium AAP81b]